MVQPPIPAGNGMRWQPIWAMTDDFQNPQLRDIWTPFSKSWHGRAPSFFRPGNVTVRDGKLMLQAREDQTHLIHDYNLRMQLSRINEMTDVRNQGKPPHKRQWKYQDFSSAIVRSVHKQRYGYFETYCKIADCDISSAFWLVNNEWPKDQPGSWWTELDVFEASTSTQHRGWGGEVKDYSRIMSMNHHVHRFGNDLGRAHRYEPQEYNTGVNLSHSPHLFALDWTPHYVRWYFDNKLVREIRNDYYHRPLHLQFDRETFPGWFGLPKRGAGNNKLPNSFEIHHIRSWERVR